MDDIQIRNLENEKRLKKVKAFALPTFLSIWIMPIIFFWVMFRDNGFMSKMGNVGLIIIMMLSIGIIAIIMLIVGLIRIKTLKIIFKLKADEQALKYKVSASQTYLTGLAYLNKLGETLHLFVSMTVMELVLGSMLGGGSSVFKGSSWFIVLLIFAFAQFYPKAYSTIICNEKFNVPIVINYIVDLFKIAILVLFIWMAKNFDIRKELAMVELEFTGGGVLTVFPSGASNKFSLIFLELIRIILIMAVIVIIALSLTELSLSEQGVFESLDELINGKLKKRIIIWCVLMVLDMLIHILFPSTISIVGRVGAWLSEARSGWLSCLLLLIALRLSSNIPEGKKIYEDLKQKLTGKEKRQAEEMNALAEEAGEIKPDEL